MKKLIFILLFIPSLIYATIEIDETGKVRESKGVLKYGIFGVSAGGRFSLPIQDVSKVFKGNYGPGLTITYRRLFFKELHLQLTANYIDYPGKVDNSNRFQTIPIELLGRYDMMDYLLFGLPGCAYVNLGGGVIIERAVLPLETLNNIDPIFSAGLGYEVEIINALTIQIEANYSYLYQKYISGDTRNGSFLNFGFGINYEFGSERRRR